MLTTEIDEFETYIMTELGLSRETLSAYVRDVKEFFHFIRTPQLTARLIEAFINHLRRQELKSTTIRRKCMSVRCYCHHLISLGRLDPNILDMIDPVCIERRIPDALDNKAVDTLVVAIKNRTLPSRTINVRRDVSVLLTLYHSGLRVSELCNLNLSDINTARQTIRVKGKGSRERMVPTTQKCLEAIQAYVNSDRKSNTDAIFVKGDGQRITRRAVSDMLVSLSRRAGVPHTTAHMLRKTCATQLLNNGMDIESVQVLLGHQHLSTTQDYLATNINKLKIVYEKCHPFAKRNNSET